MRESLKLDFQSKREMLNNGRPMPELTGLLQTTGQKITRSNTHIQSQIAFEKCWNLKNKFGFELTAAAPLISHYFSWDCFMSM